MKSVEQQTPVQRLTSVLVLALTASTEKRSAEAIKLAASFTEGLTAAEIEVAKLVAAAEFEALKNPEVSLEDMTPVQRFTGICILVLTAPSDEEAKAAVELAKSYAEGLTQEEIATAKATALAEVKARQA